VRDVFPAAGSVLDAIKVRMRCAPCEVAWSGPADSRCWVCDEAGSPLHTAIAVRDRGALAPFDFDLFG
jgi:hypothetical protein